MKLCKIGDAFDFCTVAKEDGGWWLDGGRNGTWRLQSHGAVAASHSRVGGEGQLTSIWMESAKHIAVR